MEKQISIYEGLATADKCFTAIGETGSVIRDELVPALRGWVETMRICADTDDRIQAIASASQTRDSVRDQLIIARFARISRQLETRGVA